MGEAGFFAFVDMRFPSGAAGGSYIKIGTRKHNKLRLFCFPFLTGGLSARICRSDWEPDKVILWVAHKDKEALPANVVGLKKRGLSIRTCKDTRSYKKIVPTLRAHPDAFIATADDDLYYDRYWLQDLTDAWSRSAGIVCHRAHGLLLDLKGRPLPYNDWEYEVEGPCSSSRLFPTSGAGVLYPPGSLSPETTNEKQFLKLAPSTDDVWLYFMGLLAGSSFTKTAPPRALVMWEKSQEDRLWNINIGGGNDKAIKAMIAEYGLPKAVLTEHPSWPRTNCSVNKMLMEDPLSYG